MYEKVKAINAPVFSAKSGFYEDAFDLSIFTEEGSSAYYTLDGSIPDVHSIPYTEPIRIRYGGGRESRVTHIRNTHINWRDSDGESHPLGKPRGLKWGSGGGSWLSKAKAAPEEGINTW